MDKKQRCMEVFWLKNYWSDLSGTNMHIKTILDY